MGGLGWIHRHPRDRGSMARREGEIFVVDDARCYGCAACIAFCPVDALSLEGLLALVAEPICTHCELCIPACPVHALSFESQTTEQSA